MSSAFLNSCRFSATSSGTGDFVVLSAVLGYQTPSAAGALNGRTFSYRAESADLSEWEDGYGVYTSSSTTLARTAVSSNSLGTTSKINFTNAPQVAITALTRDLGYPEVYSVGRQYYGDPTGVIDSSARIQAAINDAQTTGYGGVIDLGPGTFLAENLSITGTGVTIRGAGRLSTILRGITSAPNIISTSGPTCSYFALKDIAIAGPDGTVIGPSTLVALNGCQGGEITNCYFANGYVAISATNSTNNRITFNKIDNVYGTAWVNFASGGGGNYFHDNQLDQAYFTPTYVNFTIGASLGAPRAAGVAYSTKQMVSSGGFWYVCSAAGTSVGAGTITPSYFGNPIADPGGGTLRWLLIGRTDAVLIYNSSAPQNYIHDNDLTAICAYQITMLNCDGTQINHNQGGGAMQGFINIGGGNTNITIDANYFTSSNGYGIIDTSASSSELIITGNKLNTIASNGILVGGTILGVDKNIINQSGQVTNDAAIAFYGGTSQFTCQGNKPKKGSAQTSAAMIQVLAGASDYYDITGNIGNGFATVVSDAGTGTHKTVSPNW